MKWLLHDNEKENLFCSDFHYKCSLLNSFTLIITSAFSPSDSKEWSPFITHIRINVRLQAWNKGERNVNVNHRLRALFSLSSGRLLYQEKIDQHLFHVIFKKMYLINYILVSRRKKSHNYGHNEPLLKRKENNKKKKSSSWRLLKNTMYINKGMMDRYIRGTDSWHHLCYHTALFIH